jgi:hypothetical protein
VDRLITIRAGEAFTSVRVTLTAQGVITGKVEDADGWPAVNARIRALRYEFPMGTRRIWPQGRPVETDDRGEFRLFGMPPGGYYLRADPGSQLSGFDERHTAAFYPAAYTLSDAAMVTVESGKETSGIRIRLGHMDGFRISGRVVGPRGLALTLTIHAANAENLSMAIRLPESANGSFVFRHMPPGVYRLLAGGSAELTHREAVSGLAASRTVEVRGSDVSGIELVVAAFDVFGKLTIEGKDQPGEVEIALRSTSGRRYTAKTGTDGSFVIRGVPPGDLMVAGPTTPAGLYLKAVRLAGKEVAAGIDFDGSSTGPLEILMSSARARVEGVVLDRAGQPAQGPQVCFVGRNLPARVPLRCLAADQSGRFSALDGLRPGEYNVVVVSRPDLCGLTPSPELLPPEERRVRTVTLVEGDNPALSFVL